MSNPPSCELSHDSVVINDDLCISFHRTIRVPDNCYQVSYLPPDLGKFPLQSVSKYASKLPNQMKLKGGIFFPMYREFLYNEVAR